MNKRLALIFIGLILISAAFMGCAPANKAQETYPTRQIEYVVSFAAGGITDLVARATADYVSKEWGKPVIIVNKPGGGGAIGAQAALKQAGNDGYTVFAPTVTNTALLNAGMSKAPIKIEDHIFTARLVTDSLVFAVKTDAPWKDMKEFSEWAKQNPDQLTWTGVGAAGQQTFIIAEWMQAIGADFKKTRMIASTGSADGIPKVAGGHAVLAVQSIGDSMSMLKAGKIRALAVASPQRSPFLPEVPTLVEQGINGVTTVWWTGVSLPVGTPANVVKKWEEVTAKMVKDPIFLNKLKNINVEAAYLNAADFTKSVQNETTRFTEMATKLGIRK